ncbi:MAG: DUF305 domain-containing protein [Gemmatimonadota bacterium]
MNTRTTSTSAFTALAVVLAGCGGSAASSSMPAPSDGPRIVQPGAPGQGGRTFSTEELDNVEGVTHVAADVHFMQGMIPHHQQALQMTALVRQHAATDAVRQMALRMEISQRDEIKLMETWLTERGESTEMSAEAMAAHNMTSGTMGGGMDHSMHGSGMQMVNGLHYMPGMLTTEQFAALENARGVEFDRLFLEGMIQHHQGAIDMVATLFNTSGAAQESTIFKFAEDVDADQQMEIDRMQGILDQLR